jgi:hypothetical protein
VSVGVVDRHGVEVAAEGDQRARPLTHRGSLEPSALSPGLAAGERDGIHVHHE